MPDQDSRSEYARRMHRVLEYIDQHLEEPLELRTLADVANFSPFHFHRLFAAWMGERLGEYLRRRRIEVAALRLIAQPRAPVLHTALSVGFGSSEAFSRAFKARFGETPSSWRARQHRNRNQEDRKNSGLDRSNDQELNDEPGDHGTISLPQEVTMDVKLVDRQPVTVAYLRHVGPYGKALSDFWINTVAPWMATNNLLGRPRYGISHDDDEITAPEKLRYDAAVEVAPDFTGSGQYMKTVIPGGKYAAGRFRGTEQDISTAWDTMLRDWLPSSGMQLDARPFFEYYSADDRYDPATGAFECTICVPVVAL